MEVGNIGGFTVVCLPHPLHPIPAPNGFASPAGVSFEKNAQSNSEREQTRINNIRADCLVIPQTNETFRLQALLIQVWPGNFA